MYLQWQTNRKMYQIYRTVPFSITLNDSYNPDFKDMPLFDVDYFRTLQCNAIETYTCSGQRCNLA